jgi:Glutaminase A six helical-hairpin domain
LWPAAWLSGQPVRDTLINGVYGFANGTSGRVPCSDWYVVANANVQGFAARPVVGGFLALLAVSGQSLANSAEVTQYTDNGTEYHLWRFTAGQTLFVTGASGAPGRPRRAGQPDMVLREAKSSRLATPSA